MSHKWEKKISRSHIIWIFYKHLLGITIKTKKIILWARNNENYWKKMLGNYHTTQIWCNHWTTFFVPTFPPNVEIIILTIYQQHKILVLLNKIHYINFASTFCRNPHKINFFFFVQTILVNSISGCRCVCIRIIFLENFTGKYTHEFSFIQLCN